MGLLFVCAIFSPMKKPDKGYVEGFKRQLDEGKTKTLADAVGLPDEDDWKNIVKMIAIYREATVKKYGYDILVETIANARKDASNADAFLLVNKDSNMRHVFELPESFVNLIEKAYPLMFKSKKHFSWFARHFKELRISEKY